jgi:hypothetical protein
MRRDITLEEKEPTNGKEEIRPTSEETTDTI